MREDARSPIWGGATLGLVVGLILGFFVGTYWITVLYAVGLGAAVGVAASILGRLGDKRAATPPKTNPADAWNSLQLSLAEGVLGQCGPADFETTQNAASMCVTLVGRLEDGESWRAGYDSLDSFYAAHEARHPNIRFYAAVSHDIPIEDPDNPPNGIGAVIARQIALRRPPATI